MKTLLVTGGIGSGKSMVCRMLSSDFGIPVFDSDSAAKSLYGDGAFLDTLEKELGVPLRDDSGKFDSAGLSSLIFGDGSCLFRKKVEALVHPEVYRMYGKWAREVESDSQWRAFEGAASVNTSALESFGSVKTLLVDAPEEVRIQRVLRRSPGLSSGAIRSRIAAQHFDRGAVDFIIDNIGSCEALRGKVAALTDNLKNIDI
ncbi:MAG: dephospho-CoA kinase [Bacteroidales bacterium]|nr:dephospho-CoA kinase [Bacteroidales bacterium]